MNERKVPPPTMENDDAGDPGRGSSAVVFSGDPAQVSAGFALALRLPGIDVPMPEPSGDRTEREE